MKIRILKDYQKLLFKMKELFHRIKFKRKSLKVKAKNYNKEFKETEITSEILAFESRIVSKTSLEVLAEFENISY
jgi:hypothetical protein